MPATVPEHRQMRKSFPNLISDGNRRRGTKPGSSETCVRARRNGNDLLGQLALLLVNGMTLAGVAARVAEDAALQALGQARQEFAGCHLYVPKVRCPARDRRGEALEMWTAGSTFERIAGALDVTPRYAAVLVAIARGEQPRATASD